MIESDLWQPIETAPSGVPILACLDRPSGPCTHFVVLKDIGGKFPIIGTWPRQICDPTHWQELTRPSKEQPHE